MVAGALRAVGLGIDDDIAQIKVVIARIAEIIAQGAGPRGVPFVENFATHDHAGKTRGDMIRRAPEKAEMAFGPCFEGAPAGHQLFISLGKLPAAVDPLAAVGRDECQRLDILRRRLKIIQQARRRHRIAEGGVAGDIRDALPLQKHLAPVAQGVQMNFAGFSHCHAPL